MSDKGGRPVGSTQDKVNARKSLKLLEELHKNINSDVMDAYTVLIQMLNNTETKDTVRKAIAKDIVALFMEFSGNSNAILGAPTNRHEEKLKELGDKAQELSGQKVVQFSTKA